MSKGFQAHGAFDPVGEIDKLNTLGAQYLGPNISEDDLVSGRFQAKVGEINGVPTLSPDKVDAHTPFMNEIER